MNLSEKLSTAIKGMHKHSYRVIVGFPGNYETRYQPTNSPLYRMHEQAYNEAQDEIRRKNKRSMLKEMKEAGITTGSFGERVNAYREIRLKECQIK